MSKSTGSTWLNALIGAIATIVLSFTIVSPVLGGALAGYLERSGGVRVGAIAGVIAAIPVLLLGIAFVGLFPAWGGGPRVASLLFVVLLLFLVPLYIIGLSALGGYLGVYVRTDVLGGDR